MEDHFSSNVMESSANATEVRFSSGIMEASVGTDRFSSGIMDGDTDEDP